MPAALMKDESIKDVTQKIIKENWSFNNACSKYFPFLSGEIDKIKPFAPH